MRRAKIVCTLGPATGDEDKIRQLVDAGMDVARFNMSHGDHPEHERRLAIVREAAEANGKAVAVLADLQGPKIRLGVFEQDKVQLQFGQQFIITTEQVKGTAERASTTFQGLPGDVDAGDTILIDDGRVALECVRTTDTEVVTRVTVAGPISHHKGINLPGVPVSIPAMTDKDEADLRWALRHGFDLVALSFVRRAADVTRIREIMAEEGRKVPVIAKIEKPQAMECLEEVVDAFDGVMVARGDLGVELPLEQVPVVQRRIIQQARRWAKPVIVATQMLESMISAPRPTRAEASDVANAILDGADAVMLSGETAVGQYPIVTVQTMARIVDSTMCEDFDKIRPLEWDPHTTGGVIAMAASEVARRVDAKYLVAFTKSGDTARRLARLRQEIPVLAFTPEPQTRQTLAAVWGVESFITRQVDTTDEMVQQVEEALMRLGRLEVGDRVVMVSGSPLNLIGKTNALRVHKIRPSNGQS